MSGFISIAYSHYVSPNLKNPVLHRAYSHYVRTGKLLQCKAPAAVSEAKCTGGILSWNGISGNEWLLGYRVRRDGVLVADCQLTHDGSCKCSINADTPGIYAITAYDAWGNESSAVEVKVP